MNGLAAWLMAMAVPLAARVIVGLGFAVASFAGMQVTLAQLVALAQSNWSALPATVLQLASLSGIPEMLGMMFAAAVFRLAAWVAVQGTRFVLRS